jgi:hypothetical protein
LIGVLVTALVVVVLLPMWWFGLLLRLWRGVRR